MGLTESMAAAFSGPSLSAGPVGAAAVPDAPAGALNVPGRAMRPDGPKTVKALQALAKAQQRETAQAAQVQARQAEIAELEARAADDVLDADQVQAAGVTDRLVARLAQLRGAVEIEQRAAAKAAQRTALVRREVLAAELEDVRAEQAELARQKAKHDQVLADLLDKLQQHDGAEYRPFQPDPESLSQTGAAGRSWRVSRSLVLSDQLDQQTVRMEILTAAVTGQQVPTLRHGMSIEPHLYSRFVRGPEAFPEFQ